MLCYSDFKTDITDLTTTIVFDQIWFASAFELLSCVHPKSSYFETLHNTCHIHKLFFPFWIISTFNLFLLIWWESTVMICYIDILFVFCHKWTNFLTFLHQDYCLLLKSTQYMNLSPNALWFIYQNLKSFKPHEIQNIKHQNAKSIGEKLKTKGLLFFISIFSLAQASCTELTLKQFQIWHIYMVSFPHSKMTSKQLLVQ